MRMMIPSEAKYYQLPDFPPRQTLYFTTSKKYFAYTTIKNHYFLNTYVFQMKLIAPHTPFG